MIETNKMFLCLFGIVMMGVVAQKVLGNEPSLIIGAIMIFSVGFGWYARKVKLDDVSHAEGEQK